MIKWHLSAARLHLQAFYLVDEASTEGYSDRIMALYQTASSLIDLSHSLNTPESGSSFDHCPFFCHQVFVCAAFIVLKILSNGYFSLLFDVAAGRRLLDSSIAALRGVSVANNDLPARLGDVVAFFCTLDDPTVLGGATADQLRLREVRNRLSMSVVYDSLWIWRRHFQVNNSHVGGAHNTTTGSPASQARLAFGYDDGQGHYPLGGSHQGPGFAGLLNLDWPF